MAVTPQITLTANLQSILGGTETGGYLRITLCGSGPVIPAVPGTCLLADATIPQLAGPQEGSTPLSVELYGNDVIVPGPDITFYEIAVLDSNQNVVQAGNYRFDGTEAVDLSSAAQIVAPYGFPTVSLRCKACTGAVPGSAYTAPGAPVIAVFVNGILQRPTIDWSAAGAAITLTFETQVNNGIPDTVYALCVA